MTLCDLRAISEGYNIEDVELFGSTLLMNEAFDAVRSKIRLKLSADMKEAKAEMRLARKLSRTDIKESIKHYDKSLTALKRLRQKAKQIEDDHIAEYLTIAFFKILVTDIIFTVFSEAILGKAINGIIKHRINIGAVKSVDTNSPSLSGVAMIVLDVVLGTKMAVDLKQCVSSGVYEGKRPENVNKWYKVGVSRVNTLKSLDKLISVAEQGKRELMQQLKIK